MQAPSTVGSSLVFPVFGRFCWENGGETVDVDPRERYAMVVGRGTYETSLEKMMEPERVEGAGDFALCSIGSAAPVRHLESQVALQRWFFRTLAAHTYEEDALVPPLFCTHARSVWSAVLSVPVPCTLMFLVNRPRCVSGDVCLWVRILFLKRCCVLGGVLCALACFFFFCLCFSGVL